MNNLFVIAGFGIFLLATTMCFSITASLIMFVTFCFIGFACYKMHMKHICLKEEEEVVTDEEPKKKKIRSRKRKRVLQRAPELKTAFEAFSDRSRRTRAPSLQAREAFMKDLGGKRRSWSD